MTTAKMENMIKSFCRKMVNVTKNDETKLSIPAPVALLCLLIFRKLTVLGFVAALVMGCKFSVSEKPAEAAEAVKAPCAAAAHTAPVMYSADNQ